MVDKKKQGKKNRKSGAAFELKVRKDLEEKGWVVSKWQNQVELILRGFNEEIKEKVIGKAWKKTQGRLIPAKKKFNPFSKALSLGTGFPDFICFRQKYEITTREFLYEVIGAEAKVNGYLDKIEKEKCIWLLDNRIFSKIFIAKKGKKGEIIYTDFLQPSFPMEIDNKI